jgi:hypothetical protein
MRCSARSWTEVIKARTVFSLEDIGKALMSLHSCVSLLEQSKKD